MKYASLIYSSSYNLGDQIQSLAAEQFLPGIDARFDRDYLREAMPDDQYLLIMQGWFSHYPERCFPPSDRILPVFFGFHITDWNQSWDYFLQPQVLDYLKLHEPIGCRDQHTAAKLSQHGINAYYSSCLTLTFPTREKAPLNGKIYTVDVAEDLIPIALRKECVPISQNVQPLWSEGIKNDMAKHLLKTYKDNARLMITTKLHAALPCIAMGIPVIFFGNTGDYRISVIKDLGIPIHAIPERKQGNKYANFIRTRLLSSRMEESRREYKWQQKLDSWIDWNPAPVSFESRKSEIISNLRKQMELVIRKSL
jgi:hypothetical protein